MIFEISTLKLAKISSKILDTKKKIFLVELCYQTVPSSTTNETILTKQYSFY